MNFEQATIKVVKELDRKGDKFSDKEELKDVKIGKNDLEEVLNYLSHKKLIIYSENAKKLRISPAEGRDFLTAYKKDTNQHEFNMIVAFTGLILAVIGIFNFLKEDFAYQQLNRVIFYTKMTMPLILILCALPLAYYVVKFYIDKIRN